ncbi:A/G-specific adenine glycosylase [Planctomycetaceae bacterium SH139]
MATIPHAADWQDKLWRRRVRSRLLRWFDDNERVLPWRETSDPYAIWISEIMLQQTQVATVIPYYQRFLKRFPDVTSLAETPMEELLTYWEGLGYYRRARQLHAAAQQIVAEYAGCFPTTFAEVLALPGIGRYTAGAILSISQDQRLPIVEANTVRLFSRLIGLRRPPAESASLRLLWQVAEALLPTRSGSGRLNQALMEFGALACTPQNPSCETCPLQSDCATYALGLQAEIPGKVKHIKYEERVHWAVAVRRGEHYFLRVCPPDAHWAGMWDFPRFDVTGLRAAADEAIRAAVRAQFAAEFGWEIELDYPLGVIKHAVTKYRITLHAHHAEPVAISTCRETAEGQTEAGWFTATDLQKMALNTSARKLARTL